MTARLVAILRKAPQRTLGWLLVLAGAAALLVGWIGVSGEVITAKQLPYLVSGGLGGIGLLVLAHALLTTDDVRRQLSRLDGMEERMTALYDLLVEEVALTAAPDRAMDRDLVAVKGGRSYHRPSCPFVRGKPTVAVRRADTSLAPCSVCEPGPAAVAG